MLAHIEDPDGLVPKDQWFKLKGGAMACVNFLPPRDYFVGTSNANLEGIEVACRLIDQLRQEEAERTNDVGPEA